MPPEIPGIGTVQIGPMTEVEESSTDVNDAILVVNERLEQVHQRCTAVINRINTTREKMGFGESKWPGKVQPPAPNNEGSLVRLGGAAEQLEADLEAMEAVLDGFMR